MEPKVYEKKSDIDMEIDHSAPRLLKPSASRAISNFCLAIRLLCEDSYLGSPS